MPIQVPKDFPWMLIKDIWIVVKLVWPYLVAVIAFDVIFYRIIPALFKKRKKRNQNQK